jgi:MarR family transcriptional regulator, organic hydroperoxide resistance regulator
MRSSAWYSLGMATRRPPTPRLRSPRAPSAVQTEIRQRRPFRTAAQEATVGLLRTASVVRRALARVVEPSGLSLAQYNALRIIHGAGRTGIPTLAIRDRLIEDGTPITRLLDKLEAQRLIHRERAHPDRRQVICHLTEGGRRLLADVDPRVDAADAAALAALTANELTRLVQSLDRVRAAHAARRPARGTEADTA